MNRKRAAIEKIPEHLTQFVVEQDASLYTPIDHACWRYIMRVSQSYFAKHAHQKYLDGLVETGISTERIPLIEEMDACLRRFGWRAVAVSGFIPPAVFMEFQSLGIMPIACDMRKLEHLAYTPAPDIVHEAAGHAPIVADPEYSNYLLSYGEVSRKAVYSKTDMELYHAIRNLSEVKEDPAATPERIQAAQRRLDETVGSINYMSEATQLARMYWWSAEYGLVGDPSNPKIYGAGLLSSVGESYQCLSDKVKKVPFTLDCINRSYDITKPQPQLHVTPDFNTLTHYLEEFSKTMAYRRGGWEGLAKAKACEATTTVQLETGVQISGTLVDIATDSRGEACYLRYAGPVQLAYGDHELEGQGAGYHKEGFSTPLGEFHARGALELGKPARLEFERSGITVEGKLKSRTERGGKAVILSFNECTVKRGSQILFDPSWGTFDMACGAKVVSVFGGPADLVKYVAATGGYRQEPGKPKSNLTAENRALNELYARLRHAREAGKREGAELEKIERELSSAYPDDWLLRLELLELNSTWNLNAAWAKPVRDRLTAIGSRSPEKAELIGRGLELLA